MFYVVVYENGIILQSESKSKYYRGMRKESDNLPEIGEKSNLLGVRIIGENADIKIEQSYVYPSTGGMSVSNNPDRLPQHIKFGIKKGEFYLFEINEEDLPELLIAQSDTKQHWHFLIEPRCPMLYGTYKGAIEETRSKWKLN